MNKKIFLLNILVFSFFLICLEFICLIDIESANIKEVKRINKNINIKEHIFKYTPGYKILKDFPLNKYRPYSYKNSDKKSILWFGCSFAEGSFTENGNAPFDKLSKLTNRNCINRAQGATGTQHILNQLNKFDFHEIAPDVEYVIYVFIPNHLHRLYNYQLNSIIPVWNIRYEYKNNRIQEINPLNKYWYSSYLVKKIGNIKLKNSLKKEEQDLFLFNLLMREISEKLKEIYPNAKFIMIEFQEINNPYKISSEEIQKLNSYGIDVIKLRDYTTDIDITDKKYWFEDGVHPRPELWDKILPALVKKYNM